VTAFPRAADVKVALLVPVFLQFFCRHGLVFYEVAEHFPCLLVGLEKSCHGLGNVDEFGAGRAARDAPLGNDQIDPRPPGDFRDLILDLRQDFVDGRGSKDLAAAVLLPGPAFRSIEQRRRFGVDITRLTPASDPRTPA
jgi:hypothetical protein